MNIHYTDEEKIKRLLAWHESDKKDLATQAARIVQLEAALREAKDVFYESTCLHRETREKKLENKIRALLEGGAS